MYIPDEWEPAEWEEASGKECRRLKQASRSRSCVVAMGQGGGRSTALHVPDMPGKLDGQGNGTAAALREPGTPSCVVVEAKTPEKNETPD